MFSKGYGAVKYIKKAAVILLGVALLGLAVVIWGFVTGSITSYAERAWCRSAAYPANCHFRGVWAFLIWCIVGVVNILIAGFLLERFGKERNRHR
jgi:uncharacterized membrane protein